MKIRYDSLLCIIITDPDLFSAEIQTYPIVIADPISKVNYMGGIKKKFFLLRLKIIQKLSLFWHVYQESCPLPLLNLKVHKGIIP